MSHTKKLVLARDQIRAEAERRHEQVSEGKVADDPAILQGAVMMAKGLDLAVEIIEKLMRD